MRQRPVTFFVVVVALLMGVIWWLRQSPNAPVPQKVAETPPVEAPNPPTPIPPPPAPRVEIPVVKSAPESASVPTTTDDADKNDPQLNLYTAIADIITRLQAGDINVLNEYLPPGDPRKMSPERLAQMKRMSQIMTPTPQEQKNQQMIVDLYQGLFSRTPTYNAAGDEVDYGKIDPNGSNSVSLVFKKIDGRWYMDE
jgi:hypothetical protein